MCFRNIKDAGLYFLIYDWSRSFLFNQHQWLHLKITNKVLQFTIIYLANLFEEGRDKNCFHPNYFQLRDFETPSGGQRLIRYDFILFNLLRKHVVSLNINVGYLLQIRKANIILQIFVINNRIYVYRKKTKINSKMEKKQVDHKWLNLRGFFIWIKSKKKVPNQDPEHLFFRWIVLRIVIWYLFWEIWAKVENFWD